MLDYWTERAKQEYVPRTSFAVIYAHLSDQDRAMRWLEEGYKGRESNLRSLYVRPSRTLCYSYTNILLLLTVYLTPKKLDTG